MKNAVLFVFMLVVTVVVSAQGKWKYHLGLGGELKDGNVNTFTVRNDGSVERNDSILAFDGGYALVYGEKDKVAYDKSFAGHVKFDVWQYDRWSPFVSLSLLSNRFKGFDYRLSFLAGVKYRIISGERCDYSISVAYVQDYTDYIDPSVSLDAMVSRLSLRFKMRHKIADNVFVNHVTYWQPSLMTPLKSISEDFVLSSVTSVVTKITDHISFDVSFNYDYHSLVPDGVEKQDVITAVSLKVDW